MPGTTGGQRRRSVAPSVSSLPTCPRLVLLLKQTLETVWQLRFGRNDRTFSRHDGTPSILLYRGSERQLSSAPALIRQLAVVQQFVDEGDGTAKLCGSLPNRQQVHAQALPIRGRRACPTDAFGQGGQGPTQPSSSRRPAVISFRLLRSGWGSTRRAVACLADTTGKRESPPSSSRSCAYRKRGCSHRGCLGPLLGRGYCTKEQGGV